MITRININNFKCFNDQPVQFRNLTVLAGENGAGKSSVIQSLLLIRNTIEKIRQSLGLLGECKIGPSNQELKITFAQHLSFIFGNSREITSVLTDSEEITISLFFDDDCMHFTYNASKVNPNLFVTLLLTDDVIQVKDLDRFSSSIFANSFHYIEAERIGPRDVQDVSEQDYLSTGYYGELTGFAMHKSGDKILPDEKCTYNETIGDSRMFKKQVEAWLNEIVPGVEVYPELFDKINAVRVGLRRRSSGTDYLHPGNIGFGITYVLPVIVSGLLAEKGNIFIVENPEAHLHPAGQSKIGQFLAQIAATGVQVIVETHSEHVINGIRLATLKGLVPFEQVMINFFKQDVKDETPHIHEIVLNEKADLSDWPKRFMDQEEMDLAEIFRLSRKKNNE